MSYTPEPSYVPTPELERLYRLLNNQSLSTQTRHALEMEILRVDVAQQDLNKKLAALNKSGDKIVAEVKKILPSSLEFGTPLEYHGTFHDPVMWEDDDGEKADNEEDNNDEKVEINENTEKESIQDEKVKTNGHDKIKESKNLKPKARTRSKIDDDEYKDDDDEVDDDKVDVTPKKKRKGKKTISSKLDSSGRNWSPRIRYDEDEEKLLIKLVEKYHPHSHKDWEKLERFFTDRTGKGLRQHYQAQSK